MMTWRADSRVIRASAGYGKTETLCMRLLTMMLGDPGMIRKIVALTFTRAAAAEIYTRLLTLICDALNKEGGIDELRANIVMNVGRNAADAKQEAEAREQLRELVARMTETQLIELLRALIDAMGELKISTIDSFFYQLIGAYSIELGLPGRVELASEGDKATADMLLRETLHTSDGGNEDFIEACAESRHGEENKSVFSTCVELLTDIRRYDRFCGVSGFWGGDFDKVKFASKEVLEAAFRHCEEHDWDERADDYKEILHGVFSECAAAVDGNYRFGGETRKTLRKFFKVLNEFPVRKPEDLSEGWDYTDVADDIRSLVDNARRVLIAQCAKRSRGLGRMLEAYRAVYDREMIRKGRLNFSDLPRLLTEEKLEQDSYALNEIQYRTNSRFQHFLLDEFQDTSRLQWEALRPFVGDNGDGDHSLLLVGDVKQAIYGWRDGDSKLMGEIAANRSLIQVLDELPCSYRYGKNICDVLNRLFDPEMLRRLDALPPSVITSWEEVFSEHRPADKPAAGEFAVYALAPVPGAKKDDFAERAAVLILDWLENHDFFSGGYSVGVLVRDNQYGIALRDALVALDREHADLFVWESDENIAADYFVAALLAFGVYVQFPGETLARETVRMTPLLCELLPESEAERRRWLDILGESGVHGFLQTVLKELCGRAASRSGGERVEPPSGGNVETLLAVARDFDAVSGVCDMRRFRDRAVLTRKPASPAEGKLRILTVHHSKGLTFHTVFYPMFDNTKHVNWCGASASGAVSNGAWLLYSPREEGMLDPRIAAAAEARHADSVFEDLCLLYVAVTRASRGMYVLLPPRSKKKLKCFHPDWHPKPPKKFRREAFSRTKQSYYASDMVFESFFAFDDRFAEYKPLPLETVNDITFIRSGVGSFEAPVKKAQARVEPLRIDPAGAFSAPRRLRRAAPSHLADGAATKLYFALPDPESGAELGTRLHEFFAKIDRWSDFDPPADADPVILRHYRACADNSDVRELFNEDCEVWKERLFDVILPDGEGGRAIVTGCFDRVHIRRAPGGGVESASIIDFKSNNTTREKLPELCDHYRRQLETYRAALAKLLGITPNVIECKLLFTKIGALETI